MAKTFTNEEKLFIIHKFIIAEGQIPLEQFITNIATEFRCEKEDIKLLEWADQLEIGGATGIKDRLIRVMGALGVGVGFGVPGVTIGAFVDCAIKGIPFALSSANYISMITGFAVFL